MGYIYDRWLAVLHVGFVYSALSRQTDLPAAVVDGKTEWQNAGLEVGYRWLRRGRWEATTRGRALWAALVTGVSSNDLVRLRNDFAPGFAQSVGYVVGPAYRGESATGRANGFRIQATVGYTPQRWLEGLRGGVLSVGVGVQYTGYTDRYQERRERLGAGSRR